MIGPYTYIVDHSTSSVIIKTSSMQSRHNVIKCSIQLEALRALVEYMRLIYLCHLCTTVTPHVISIYSKVIILQF